MEIALKPEHARMIEEEIARGNFSSAEEVVAEAIDLLARQREAELDDLRKALQEGFDAIERGDCTELRTPEDFTSFATEVGRRAKTRNAGVAGD
jgi:antitoxin ParD1/3/4